MLGVFFGTDYKKIYFTNRSSWSNKLYINNGIGYAIGNWSALTAVGQVDLDWSPYCGNNYYEADDYNTCDHCGCEIDEDDTYYSEGGNGPFCQECYDDYYFRCANCNDEYRLDDRWITNNDEWYCSDCYAEHFISCERCENSMSRDDGDYITLNECAYCMNCAEQLGIERCDCCAEYTDAGLTVVVINSKGYEQSVCPDCLEREEVLKCGECDGFFELDDPKDAEHYQDSAGNPLCYPCYRAARLKYQIPLIPEVTMEYSYADINQIGWSYTSGSCPTWRKGNVTIAQMPDPCSGREDALHVYWQSKKLFISLQDFEHTITRLLVYLKANR